jgi:hypothetical protein
MWKRCQGPHKLCKLAHAMFNLATPVREVACNMLAAISPLCIPCKTLDCFMYHHLCRDIWLKFNKMMSLLKGQKESLQDVLVGPRSKELVARLLGSLTRIPIGAWMFCLCVYMLCCPVSVVAFATCTKESYHVSEIKETENSKRRPWPDQGWWTMRKKDDVLIACLPSTTVVIRKSCCSGSKQTTAPSARIGNYSFVDQHGNKSAHTNTHYWLWAWADKLLQQWEIQLVWT